MPFVKPTIEKRTKVTCPDAYWDYLGFGHEKRNRLLYIVFGAWTSKEAHDAEAEPIPGLEERINFTGQDYKDVLKALQQSDGLVSKIAGKIDDLALAHLFERDENGALTETPFFTAQQRVEPDLSVLQ